MIEFKGECGHTVRAKDQDAGKLVRCSYCGKMSKVPESHSDDLDFLLTEVDRAASASTAAPAAPRRKRRRNPRSSPGPYGAVARRPFNPFPLALKMGYLAVLVILVYFVVSMYLLPLFENPERGPKDRSQKHGINQPAGQPSVKPGASRPIAGSRSGLLRLDGSGGLYVSATPTGSRVLVAPSSGSPAKGRVVDASGCRTVSADEQLTDLPEGQYVVEIVLVWNDPELKRYPNYNEFRRGIEQGGDSERRKLMTQYFLPDDASAVFVDQGRDQVLYLVRQYRDVEVRRSRWSSVRGMFLPRIARREGRGFSIEHLRGYMSQEDNYSFNEQDVRDELAYYQVPDTDRQFVIDVLKRLGQVPYVTPDGRMRLFKIRIEDGRFAAPELREAVP
jgi:hypothetical protein